MLNLCRLETDSTAALMRVQGGSPMTPLEQIETFTRNRDSLRSVLRTMGHHQFVIPRPPPPTYGTGK